MLTPLPGPVSATKAGLAPALPNDATRYLDGTGAYTSPPGTTTVPGGVCGLRLTLTTGVPVTKSDVASTTLYCTPYRGTQVALYSGSSWTYFSTAEISLALGTLISDTNYDVFIYSNSGTPALELSAAWTNNTTRANALAYQDGVLVKSSDHTRRYKGTFHTISTTQTADSDLTRNLADYDWPVAKRLMVVPGYNDNAISTGYTSSSSSWVTANGGTGASCGYASCNGDYAAHLGVFMAALNSGANGNVVGIFFSSTSTVPVYAYTFGTAYAVAYSPGVDRPPSGGWFSATVQVRVSGGTGTFYADDGARGGGTTDPRMTRIEGTVWV